MDIIKTSIENIPNSLILFIEETHTYKSVQFEFTNTIPENYCLYFTPPEYTSKDLIVLLPSEINLPCSHKRCNQKMIHKRIDTYRPNKVDNKNSNILVEYECKHCQSTFSIPINTKIEYDNGKLSLTLTKFGRFPPNDINIPKEISSLANQLNSDQAKEIKHLFSSGRISEEHNLGIGAFSYYRQIIELLRIILFEQFIIALKKINADQIIIDDFTKAKETNSFTNSMYFIKDKLPERLKLNGNNPIKVLFKAYSAGVHLNKIKDNDCVETATTLRIILLKTIHLLDEIITDDQELIDAINAANDFTSNSK